MKQVFGKIKLGTRILDYRRGMWRLVMTMWVIGIAVLRWLYARVRKKMTTPMERAQWTQEAARDLLRVWGVSVQQDNARRSDVNSEVAVDKAGLVVCNHLGYLDILVLAAGEQPVVFMAKSEVRGWPVFGWLTRMAGTLFVDRARRGDVTRMAAEMTEAIDAGVHVVVFLEGTSSDGSRVLPFKTSLLEPVVEQHWPVFPMALDYTVPRGRSASQEVCWWGDMQLLPHLFNLLTIPWIQARVALGGRMVSMGGMDRKALASVLHGRVEELRMPGKVHPAPQASSNQAGEEEETWFRWAMF